MDTLMTEMGVTAREFARMCEEHIQPKGTRIKIEDTLIFLNNCCALGVLRRESDRRTTLYFATGETLLWTGDSE